ncbi:MAG: 5-oxoprolinase subunit PxpA [Armatimonadetes bacterium]|nr:5-oxoprolinase subunit PxpA [Armatimonadota bacterium]
MALPTRTVDIAADMGESFGVWTRGRDEEIAPYLTSAHIACGVHASDPGTLRRTIELLAGHGVAIGAHPGYPDLLGFGRRRMDMTPREIEDTVLYQVAVVKGMVEALGSRLQHVKPHGALYHAAEVDDLVAAAIVAATKRFVPPLAIVTTPHSRLFAQAAAAGAPAAREFFLDNAYKADGTLLSRRLPEAVLNDPEAMCRRAVEAVRAGRVAAVDGTMIEVRVDTICLHGDHEPSAVALPKLRVALEAAGVAVRPLGDFVRPPA